MTTDLFGRTSFGPYVVTGERSVVEMLSHWQGAICVIDMLREMQAFEVSLQQALQDLEALVEAGLPEAEQMLKEAEQMLKDFAEADPQEFLK